MILLDFSIEEIKEKLNTLGLESYRAKQVFVCLQQGLTFEQMTVLSKPTRTLLEQNFISQPIQILQTKVSADGTTKFLFLLSDNNIIEGVLMKYKYGNTLCVSTQVGCGMGCSFCASGLNGLVRSLSAGEILAQVICANKFLQSGLADKRGVTNVVLMGSGEPLANYDNVAKFLRLVTDPNGLMISQRNISLSTCGIVPNIYRLADDGFKVTLTISLHAPNDQIRKTLMRVANNYTISQILEACKYYFEKTGRRIVFEYILIDGVNSAPVHASMLANLLKNMHAHVNLIPLNQVEGKDLKTVTKKQAYSFQKQLEILGVHATVRRTLGDDIEGACGQLRQSYLKKN